MPVIPPRITPDDLPEVCPGCARQPMERNRLAGNHSTGWVPCKLPTGWVPCKLIPVAPAAGCSNCGHVIYLTAPNG